MRKIFYISLIPASLIILWFSLNFHQSQENCLKKNIAEQNALQKKIISLEDDLNFIKIHQKELKSLWQRGWFVPIHRLIAREELEKLRTSLTKLQYTFEPEYIKSFDDNHIFRVTKITLEVGALVDNDIYQFINKILKEFPGILIPTELNLTQVQELNEENLLALKYDKDLIFIEGKLIFEWVAMGKEIYEK